MNRNASSSNGARPRDKDSDSEVRAGVQGGRYGLVRGDVMLWDEGRASVTPRSNRIADVPECRCRRAGESCDAVMASVSAGGDGVITRYRRLRVMPSALCCAALGRSWWNEGRERGGVTVNMSLRSVGTRSTWIECMPNDKRARGCDCAKSRVRGVRARRGQGQGPPTWGSPSHTISPVPQATCHLPQHPSSVTSGTA